jgi:hypothetical protein
MNCCLGRSELDASAKPEVEALCLAGFILVAHNWRLLFCSAMAGLLQSIA